MRFKLTIVAAALAMVIGPPSGHAQSAQRLNPMITLHEQGMPVFGLYAPRARTARGRRGGGATAGQPKSRAELASEILGYGSSDFVFDGSMERSVDDALSAFAGLVGAMQAAGASTRSNPLVVKMQEIGTDYDAARAAIAKQLDAGVSTIMFVGVESAEEVRQGLAAMRFAAHDRMSSVGHPPIGV